MKYGTIYTEHKIGEGIFMKELAIFFGILIAISLLNVLYTNVKEFAAVKCEETFCMNKAESGSTYCAEHQPTPKPTFKPVPTAEPTIAPQVTPRPTAAPRYTARPSYTSAPRYTAKPSSGSSYKSNSSSKGKNSSKSSSYKSYDEGYEAVYDDDDYDDERYKYDKDYADGVDDAMDEREDDW